MKFLCWEYLAAAFNNNMISMTFISAVVFISVWRYLVLLKNKLLVHAAYFKGKKGIHIKLLAKVLVVQKNNWSFNILGKFYGVGFQVLTF